MPHPHIENKTPFACDLLFATDPDGRSVVVPIVKATYDIKPRGRLALAEKQRPVDFAGERSGPPDRSGWRYEPEIAPRKLATDVVLVASAVAPRTPARELEVTFRVGRLEKTAVVIGDRTWVKRIGGMITASDPHPFDQMPLTYERAFGGRDTSGGDADHRGIEPRNPVGTGYRRGKSFEDGIRLPNVEDPRQRIRGIGDTPPPMGFGFVSADWQPRVRFAGTYDDRWREERMPLLPADFDPRFYNAASPGLVADGHLRGDEEVQATNVTPGGTLAFRLPGVPEPTCRIAVGTGNATPVDTKLDTVVIDTEASRLTLLWRGQSPVPADPQQVRGVEVDTADAIPMVTQ